MENNTIIRHSNLPPAHAAVLRDLETRPQHYFDNLTMSTPTSMIKSESPNLWELRRLIGAVKTKAVIVYALAWLSELVNVERNLTEMQIGEIANDIIEEYGYMKPEEIKRVLKQGARSNQIYGRLDYSVVMKWLEDYDAVRTEHCIDISNQEETSAANRIADDPEAVTLEVYTEKLRAMAKDGDGNAKAKLAEAEEMNKYLASVKPLISTEDKHKKELEFFKWKQGYLKSKRK